MKTVLITGASRGIGLEFVRQYSEDGWRVLACARQASPGLENLAKKGEVRILPLDVADRNQIASLGKALFGQNFDLLLNNAGIYPESDSGGFGKTDYEDWMKAFAVNSMAPLLLAETLVPMLRKGGTIATVTSKMGSLADNTSGGSYLYRTSKAAANMVMKNLALDLAPRGLISVALHPGWVKTDMGGPHALIGVEESVSGMKRVLDRITLADSGKFVGFDGIEVPW